MNNLNGTNGWKGLEFENDRSQDVANGCVAAVLISFVILVFLVGLLLGLVLGGQ